MAQGSCLGPLLFILFTNDIHLLPIYSRIILFADDTTLFSQHKSLQFLKYMLEHDMNMLIDWFKANQLSLNVHKMVMIKFWSNNIPFEIKVDNKLIKNLQHTKFLGVTIDENPNWNEHVYNKLLSNKRLLLNARSLLPTTVLQHIYYAHIYSHLIYGLSIWGNMISKRNKNNLYKIQTECIKVLTKKAKNYPLRDLYNQYSVLPFMALIKQELTKLGYKISKDLLPGPIIDLCKNKQGKKNHKYSTRRKAILNVQWHTDHNFNISLLCKSLIYYSEPPGITRNITKFSTFKRELKNHLLTKDHERA